jgi:large subunit ribosomal protein L28
MAAFHDLPSTNNPNPQLMIFVSHDFERARWDSRETIFDHGSQFAFNPQSSPNGYNFVTRLLAVAREPEENSAFSCRFFLLKELLDRSCDRRQLTPLQNRLMSRVCNITGAKSVRGNHIHRRGLAKKKGGVGRHVTKNVPRTFAPNLRVQRIWVPELKKFVRVKATARGLKTVNKNGALKVLKKAGLI